MLNSETLNDLHDILCEYAYLSREKRERVLKLMSEYLPDNKVNDLGCLTARPHESLGLPRVIHEFLDLGVPSQSYAWYPKHCRDDVCVKTVGNHGSEAAD